MEKTAVVSNSQVQYKCNNGDFMIHLSSLLPRYIGIQLSIAKIMDL
jgi:hypothetical protein